MSVAAQVVLSDLAENPELRAKIMQLKKTRVLVYLSRHMSRIVRKLAFCICENKDADQLRGNPEADQRLCFR